MAERNEEMVEKSKFIGPVGYHNILSDSGQEVGQWLGSSTVEPIDTNRGIIEICRVLVSIKPWFQVYRPIIKVPRIQNSCQILRDIVQISWSTKSQRYDTLDQLRLGRV